MKKTLNDKEYKREARKTRIERRCKICDSYFNSLTYIQKKRKQ